MSLPELVRRSAESKVGVGPDWSLIKIAQLRFDTAFSTWSLWWADRNERWHRYPDLDATPHMDRLLQEIDEDPTATFWG